MTQYAISTLVGEVQGFAYSEGMPDVGEGFIAHVMVTPVPHFPKLATPTTKLFIANGELYPVETGALADVQAYAIAEIDRIADAARLAVVGDAARIKEYERAQQQAEVFRDSEYAGAAPSTVASWAEAKEWSAQEACDDILAAAARWLQALDGIRALRLKAKEDARRATEPAQITPIVATFTTTLTAAMQGVA